MSIFKKIALMAFSLSVIFSFSACADTSWALKANGENINAGIYIYYTILAYNQAQSKLDAAASANSSSSSSSSSAKTTQTTAETKFFEASIDGKDVKTWIKDTATESVEDFIAVEKKFDELGLSLSDEQKNAINQALDYSWSQNSKFFEKNGIGKDSLKQIIRNNYKRDMVFDSYYAKGGSEEVPQDEINKYYNENNARVKYIAIQLKDGEGNLFKSADKAKAMEMAKDYQSRATKENFDDLIKEYNDYYAKVVAEAKKDSSSSSSSSSSESSSSSTSSETEEKDPYANEHILQKGGSIPSKDVCNEIFEKCKVGETTIIEDDEVYYVVQRLDLLERTDLLESNYESILYELKEDDFNQKMKEYAKTITFVKNEDAYNRYDPEKLKLD